jgi:nitrite reductase (NADH) small subunit
MPLGDRVCQLDELPLGQGREFVIGDLVVAVFRTEAGVTAVDGICPHNGGPLAQGMVRKQIVTCPWHGWQFHLQTGCHQINPRICVPTYAVTVTDNEVYIDVTRCATTPEEAS